MNSACRGIDGPFEARAPRRKPCNQLSPSFALLRNIIILVRAATFFGPAPCPRKWVWMCGAMKNIAWNPRRTRIPPLVRPDDPLNLPGNFPLSLSGLDPRLTAQSVNSPGGPLGSGSKKEPRTERDPGDVASVERSVRPCLDNELEADLADYGLFVSSADNRRLAPSPGGRLNAINFPTARWSSFRTPYGANHLSPFALRCSTYFPPLPSGS